MAKAKAADLSPSQRIRCRGCDNSLNRSSIQTEKALDKQLVRDLPPSVEPVAEPLHDLPDADVRTAIEQGQATLQDYRNRASTKTATQQDRNKALWASAMIDTMKQTGLPLGPKPGA